MEILNILKLTILITLLLEMITLVIIELGLCRAVYLKYIKATDALNMTTMLMAVLAVTIALYVVVEKITGGIV